MLLQLSGEKEAADTKEEYENEADVNLSEGFLPNKLLIRIAKKFDLQHLNFHSYQLLTIPMKLTIQLIGKIVPEDNSLKTFPVTIKESYNVHSLNVSDSGMSDEFLSLELFTGMTEMSIRPSSFQALDSCNSHLVSNIQTCHRTLEW